MRDTAQRLRAIDKKARRKMANKVRREGVVIDDVITAKAASLRGTQERLVDTQRLSARAQRDMGRRVELTNRWHDGDSEAGKARRKLNDWGIDTKPAGPTTAWAPKRARSAVGRCDVDAVRQLNHAKRGY